jgi:uncharacterized heparinase superfamily protein
LGINTIKLVLEESGYRKLKGLHYDLFFNTGKITATFQPGHSHADAFSYCLNVFKKPIIVDRGVSTYEIGEQRMEERGTGAHNTVMVNNLNSLDVWKSFRVGKITSINTLGNSNKTLNYKHNGYKNSLNVVHKRIIRSLENKIIIEDLLEGFNDHIAYSYIHFHPSVKIQQFEEEWIINDNELKITVDNMNSFLEDYEYCLGFNNIVKSKRIVCPFITKNLKYTIDVI